MRIAVIGIGTVGVQAAYQLARRGIEVVGYEQYPIGHAAGGAGGDSRLFSRVELNDPRYSLLIERAEAIWRRLNERTGASLLTFTGGLVMGDPSLDPVRRAIESCELTSSPQVLSRGELERRFPEIRMNPGEVVLFDPNAGRIDPELSVVLTGRLAEAYGAELRPGTAVQAIESRAAGVGVRDAEGWQTYDRVVVAAGAWTGKLLGGAVPELTVRRLTSAWYFPSEAARFESFVPFIRLMPDYIYGLPSADGRAVKLGLGYDSHLPVDDPDATERWLRPGEGVGEFALLVEKYLPGLAPEPFRVETYYETYTPQRREYICELPEDERVLVLTGFSGHGFKVSPAVGELVAEWAQGEQSRYPSDLFLDL
ncbi:FAD-dependent oxidoreductase [Leucobacter sp. wl10]|uniref:FAD-dependent oxidoreductase n=1 Tax=Leucobacter sp. wl10 TaxID=2304677 RepID=UPI000E5B4173|nr:FAD-dependent oxidoreductase [Leucobacter sp. wl10]RGE22042.1 FAD-dependent oxidoreductase [Leucobacter sp. wl10]